MNTFQFQQQNRGSSSRHSRKTVHSDLKEQIKNFLSEASSTLPVEQTCPRCGQQMETVDTVFSLYGENASWHVHLPVCACISGVSPGRYKAAGCGLS